jgi:hypothetical protein
MSILRSASEGWTADLLNAIHWAGEYLACNFKGLAVNIEIVQVAVQV